MTGEGEARPASQATETQDHSRCYHEIATLRELLEEVQHHAKESAFDIINLRSELVQTVTHVETLDALIKDQNDLATTDHQKVCQKVSMQDVAIKHLQREHEQLAHELESAHTRITTMLRNEITTLREELAYLHSQHTGHEKGAERESAGVLEELSEVQK